MEMYKKVGRAVYMSVNLDAITNNIAVIRNQCDQGTGVIAVIKNNAYGHGAVGVATHLKSIGVERLAVATIDEGIQLRLARVPGPIHVFGNITEWELDNCLKYDLIPTVTTEDTIIEMGRLLQEEYFKEKINSNKDIKRKGMPPFGTIHLKVDTGMSRNGCQPEDLPDMIHLCEQLNVPVEGVFSHIADFENEDFTNEQIECFEECIEPYRASNLKFHLSSSGPILSGIATDLDFVRPGKAIFGLLVGDDIERFADYGFKPALSVVGTPTLVKQCEPGTMIGYNCSYTCRGNEWIATIPFGFGDGYQRTLSNKGIVIRKKTGEKCPVVGKISCDAVTIRLRSAPAKGESFILVSADFDPKTSVAGISDTIKSITSDVSGRFSVRVPRVFTSKESKKTMIKTMNS